MFGLFNKKDPRAVLEKRYMDLWAEAYRSKTVDSKVSDLERAEAELLCEDLNKLPGKVNATMRE